MTDARISVITPVWNGAALLPEFLESALAQTHPVDEIIVVDDGSTDETVAVASAYGPPVRVVRQEHRGIAVARNHGFRQSTGSLLLFPDSDDRYPAGAVAALREALEVDPGLGAVGGHVQEFADSDASGRAPHADPVPGAMATMMMIRREVFDLVGPFDEEARSAEALEWATRMRDAGVAWAIVPEVTYERRLHGANTGLHADKPAHLVRLVGDIMRRRRAAP